MLRSRASTGRTMSGMYGGRRLVIVETTCQVLLRLGVRGVAVGATLSWRRERALPLVVLRIQYER